MNLLIRNGSSQGCDNMYHGVYLPVCLVFGNGGVCPHNRLIKNKFDTLYHIILISYASLGPHRSQEILNSLASQSSFAQNRGQDPLLPAQPLRYLFLFSEFSQLTVGLDRLKQLAGLVLDSGHRPIGWSCIFVSSNFLSTELRCNPPPPAVDPLSFLPVLDPRWKWLLCKHDTKGAPLPPPHNCSAILAPLEVFG